MSPPYTKLVRPNFYDQPSNLLYARSYSIGINVLASAKVVQAVILDLGYSTHGVHMNNRYVELEVVRTAKHKLSIKGPRDEAMYPPGESCTCRVCVFRVAEHWPAGYAWLFILGDGVPSDGKRVMVGTGASECAHTDLCRMEAELAQLQTLHHLLTLRITS